MTLLQALACWMRRKLKRKPRISLAHIHKHQLELHDAVCQVLETVNSLSRKVEKIMSSQTEQAQILREVLAQQKKTAGEIATLQDSVTTLNTKIAELEAIIAAGGEASAELVAAVADVKAQAQLVDDQIPDVPAP
jgi:hypothetical protein